jgi:hypothetical protein
VPAAILARNCFATYLFSLQEWLGLASPALAAPEHMAQLREGFAVQLHGLGRAEGKQRSRRDARARRSP